MQWPEFPRPSSSHQESNFRWTNSNLIKFQLDYIGHLSKKQQGTVKLSDSISFPEQKEPAQTLQL